MSVFNNMSILFLLFFFLIVFEKCKFLLVKKGFYFVFKYFLKYYLSMLSEIMISNNKKK